MKWEGGDWGLCSQGVEGEWGCAWKRYGTMYSPNHPHVNYMSAISHYLTEINWSCYKAKTKIEERNKIRRNYKW